MSEHEVTIRWQRDGGAFSYETYVRDHEWSFPGEVHVPASAAPAYRGSSGRVDPEQAFVAALSSCHMLTFLAVAARRRFVVDDYEDHATAYLAENEEGRLAVTRVVLRPQVRFAPEAAPPPGELEKLHERAHRACFIAASVRTQVEIEPRSS